MTWSVIRLELARSAEAVQGDARHGYEFTAPLNADGLLDEASWREAKTKARVHRFHPHEDDETGQLIHTRHRQWAFSYAPGEEDDEPFFHLESHALRPGEYVSVTEHDGETRTFRVASVRPLPEPVKTSD